MPVAETYELITSQTLSSAVNTVSLGIIPSTYTDLIIIATCKYNGASSGGPGDINIQFNNDTAANYNYGRMVTTNTIVSGGTGSSTIINCADAGWYSTFKIHIFNYAETDSYKHALITGGSGGPSGVNQALSIGVWRNNNAISSVQVRSETGAAQWQSGSKFCVYGIKAA